MEFTGDTNELTKSLTDEHLQDIINKSYGDAIANKWIARGRDWVDIRKETARRAAEDAESAKHAAHVGDRLIPVASGMAYRPASYNKPKTPEPKKLDISRPAATTDVPKTPVPIVPTLPKTEPETSPEEYMEEFMEDAARQNNAASNNGNITVNFVGDDQQINTEGLQTAVENLEEKNDELIPVDEALLVPVGP